MNLLDLTLPTPGENLALDEALLDWAEAGDGNEILRFWEPQSYFVVLGYANKVDSEVDWKACEKLGIPFFRRCTGGGTVLQGPGCLNYTLILKIEKSPLLATIPQTNRFVMERHAVALGSLLGKLVSVRGHTDLTVDDLKFSGNAQRRKRNFLVFHGSFLLNMDLELIEKVLRMPSRMPDYRNRRSHRHFLTNVKLSSDDLKKALTQLWKANEVEPVADFAELVAKYDSPAWIRKLQ